MEWSVKASAKIVETCRSHQKLAPFHQPLATKPDVEIDEQKIG